MSKSLGAAFLAAAVSLVMACGGDDTEPGPMGGNGGGGMGGTGGDTMLTVKGSCYSEMNGICTEYLGAMYTAAGVPALCMGIGDSTHSAEACPTTGVTGTCTLGKGKENERRNRYYGSYPIAAAKTQCMNLMGEWLDP